MKKLRKKLSVCLMLAFVLGFNLVSTAYAYTVPTTTKTISSSYTHSGGATNVYEAASSYLFTGAHDYNLNITSTNGPIKVTVYSKTYGTVLGTFSFSSSGGSATISTHTSYEQIYLVFKENYSTEYLPVTFNYSLSYID